MSEMWSDDELKASVMAYLEMLRKESEELPYVKKQVYRQLSEEFGRTEKSYEYRMQNISYVYSLLGRNWVSGLKPAKNVGANIAATIERFITELEGKPVTVDAAFETEVSQLRKMKRLDKPEGALKPQATTNQVLSYKRDARVKAWVLKQSNGSCECCADLAPFISTSGDPYLEVHHVIRLADGGADTIQNTVALCPNCHRALHYSEGKSALIDTLYDKVGRLKR